MRQILVAGNWKMNGTNQSISDLLEGIKHGAHTVSKADIVVCPPFVYLASVAKILSNTSIKVGSQNVSNQQAGAYTGETNTDMLLDIGCQYAIVGHSERRALYNESDEIVAQKFAKARAAGLTPILCVGETLEEREKNITEEVVARQIDAVIKEEGGVSALADAVIAYEPVWAIGTGKTASPQQAQDVHSFIREKIANLDKSIAEKIQILYGGSMKPGNAKELIAMPDIDGGLIGGASLVATDFLDICRSA